MPTTTGTQPKMPLLEALPSMGEYDCIISNNDAMAIGAILALQELGDPAPKAVPIIGMAPPRDGQDAIQER